MRLETRLMEQADPQPVNLVHGPWNTLLGKFCLKTALRRVFQNSPLLSAEV